MDQSQSADSFSPCRTKTLKEDLDSVQKDTPKDSSDLPPKNKLNPSK